MEVGAFGWQGWRRMNPLEGRFWGLWNWNWNWNSDRRRREGKVKELG